MKPYYRTKLVHALEICHNDTFPLFGSVIYRYRISDLCSGHFSDRRRYRNLICILRNKPFGILIIRGFCMNAL